MVPPLPFSLRIFVADGDPNGLRLVERSNCIGKALVFPRKLYPEVRTRPEFQQPGVFSRSANGRIEWKSTDGQTLKQLQEAQAAE
jgi:hypothetical protein